MPEPFFNHRLDWNAFPPVWHVVSMVLATAIVGGVLLEAAATASRIVA